MNIRYPIYEGVYRILTLNYGNRHPKSLWAGDEKLQIEFMIKLHESFKEDEKPEWLTMDEILEYSKKMIAQEE